MKLLGIGLFVWTIANHRSHSSLWTHSPNSGVTCCRENSATMPMVGWNVHVYNQLCKSL
jgi:hypothetical protein